MPPRRQLVREVIRPALDAGETVITAPVSRIRLAYQGYGAGLEIDVLRRLNDLATDGLRPDRQSSSTCRSRRGTTRKAPGDVTRFEVEFDLDFHRRVQDGFLAIAAGEPERMRSSMRQVISMP